MKLSTINYWLKKVGLVLVLALDSANPTGGGAKLWIEPFAAYQKRAARA